MNAFKKLNLAMLCALLAGSQMHAMHEETNQSQPARTESKSYLTRAKEYLHKNLFERGNIRQGDRLYFLKKHLETPATKAREDEQAQQYLQTDADKAISSTKSDEDTEFQNILNAHNETTARNDITKDKTSEFQRIQDAHTKALADMKSKAEAARQAKAETDALKAKETLQGETTSRDTTESNYYKDFQTIHDDQERELIALKAKQDESDAQAKELADKQAKEAADRQAKAETARLAKELADKQAQETAKQDETTARNDIIGEASNSFNEIYNAHTKALADMKSKAEAEKAKQDEADKQAQADAQAKAEAARLAKEQADAKFNDEYSKINETYEQLNSLFSRKTLKEPYLTNYVTQGTKILNDYKKLLNDYKNLTDENRTDIETKCNDLKAGIQFRQKMIDGNIEHNKNYEKRNKALTDLEDAIKKVLTEAKGANSITERIKILTEFLKSNEENFKSAQSEDFNTIKTNIEDILKKDINSLKNQHKTSPKNPHETLGLKQGALITEIKEAYRKLALRYHPDKNKEEGAAEAFREVQKAYEVLNPDKTTQSQRELDQN